MSLIIVHDFETNGFNEKTDCVNEYAAIAFDTELETPIGFMSVLINNQVPIPPHITELTGITNDMLNKYGVSKELAVKRIEKFLSRYSIDFFMAHNEPFDRKFAQALLGRELVKTGICTQRDLKHDGAPNRKLTTLTEHYKLKHGFAHRAMTDSMACLGVALASNLYEFLGKPKETIKEIRIFAPYDDNERAKSIGFYYSGKLTKKKDGTTTKYHYRQIPSSKLDEVLALVTKEKFPLIEIVEAVR